MNLLSVFVHRRFWMIRRHWFGEIAAIFLVPILCYLSIGLGFEHQFNGTVHGYSFRYWITPGILFVIILFASFVSVFSDFSLKRNFQGLGNIISPSPHSHLTLMTGIVLSLFPEILIKSVGGGLIIILITGIKLNILPFIGLLIFGAILGLFCINLFITILLLSRGSMSNITWMLGISLILIFLSGWIIPPANYPQTISSVFSYFPTSLLAEGGRKVFLTGEILWMKGLIPFVISLCWLLLNSVLFKKESVR